MEQETALPLIHLTLFPSSKQILNSLDIKLKLWKISCSLCCVQAGRRGEPRCANTLKFENASLLRLLQWRRMNTERGRECEKRQLQNCIACHNWQQTLLHIENPEIDRYWKSRIRYILQIWNNFRNGANTEYDVRATKPSDFDSVPKITSQGDPLFLLDRSILDRITETAARRSTTGWRVVTGSVAWRQGKTQDDQPQTTTRAEERQSEMRSDNVMYLFVWRTP